MKCVWFLIITTTASQAVSPPPLDAPSRALPEDRFVYYVEDPGCWPHNKAPPNLTPERCCPDTEGHHGDFRCFDKELTGYTLERCCGRHAYFRDLNIDTWTDDQRLVLNPLPNIDLSWSAILFAPMFASVLNRQFASLSSLESSSSSYINASETETKTKTKAKDRVIVEIGVLRGEFSAALLQALTFPYSFYAIDPWIVPDPVSMPKLTAEYVGRHKYDQTKFKNDLQTAIENLTPFWGGVHIMQMYSMEALRFFDDNSISFLFIDGNHAAEAVKEEIEAYWPKITQGGILAGHDYESRGVDLVLNQFGVSINQRPKLFHVMGYNSCWYFTKGANESEEHF